MRLSSVVIAFFAIVTSACRPRGHEGPPRLVVTIVLDQLGTWVLERHWNALPADGALRTIAARGAYHHRVRYPYAATFTAPGHAAIYTGAPPSLSGIAGNRVFDVRAQKMNNVVSDPRHRVFWAGETGASPARLRAEGVADVLRASTNGRGRIVSLSNKDRGAILPGGRRPNLALWYDANAHGFTTSEYYTPRLPRWLARWNSEHPIVQEYDVWRRRASIPDGARRALNLRDNASGEGNWHGLGTHFPHDLRETTRPDEVLLATPQATESLLELAFAAAERERLGRDSVPDLLAISVSGTDYVGHVFGPESVEYVENLIEVDRALGRFLEALARRTSVAVLVTADHGVAALVERTRERGQAGHRVSMKEVADRVEAAADAAFGAGTWVAAVSPPFVHFTPAARADAGVRDRLTQIGIEAIRAIPGVHSVIDLRTVTTTETDPLRQQVALSVPSGLDADLYVVVGENCVYDEGMVENAGTSHGSPWAHDTDVPVLFAGHGVSHHESTDVLDQRRVATTISRLLRVRRPEHAAEEPLP